MSLSRSASTDSLLLLLAQLHLQNVHELEIQQKGKARSDPLQTDDALVLEFYAGLLQADRQAIEDQSLAQSMLWLCGPGIA